jgi:TolB-like protein
MKRTGGLILIFVCMVATVQPSWAKEKDIVAVLPFSVHSAENIDYVRQGIGDMLSSRISVNDKIEVIGRDVVLNAVKDTGGKDLTLADVYGLGKKLNADFVVWGSITKIGNSVSIDGKLVDIAAYKSAVAIVAQTQGLDEVIPKINEFAQKIEAHILGVAPPPPTAAASPAVPQEIIVSRQQPPQVKREAEIISGMRGGKGGTFTATINPEFINAAQPLESKTFWKSQQFPNEFRGMDIGDVNGDGLNETVIIDPHTIFIYQKKGTEFRPVQVISGKSYQNYLSVDVADINQNGIKEIIVSCLTGDVVSSFVVEFHNGKFTTIASDLPWFLRVIDNASGMPFLLGQRRGMNTPFETSIYEIEWKSGRYSEGRKMRIPQGLSVFGLTLERLGGSGTEKIISLSSLDYLYVYDQTDKPLSQVAVFGGSPELLWSSEEPYGGSNTYIEPPTSSTFTQSRTDNEVRVYLNPRIVTYDTNKDGKREVIIVKNISAAARAFSSLKLFNGAEVYDLEWDGAGMVENWRTKKIAGYVADYQFKDIDNDGENEIVLALVLSVGGSISDRSAIVSYSLKGQ